MAVRFDTHGAVQGLRKRGLEEPAAEGVVEVVQDATSEFVTKEYLDASIDRLHADLRAELYRALWVFGTGLVASMGVIVAVVNVLD